jgi:hypothetical protein
MNEQSNPKELFDHYNAHNGLCTDPMCMLQAEFDHNITHPSYTYSTPSQQITRQTQNMAAPQPPLPATPGQIQTELHTNPSMHHMRKLEVLQATNLPAENQI